MTLSGIIMFSSEEQSRKTQSSIEIILLEMVISFNEEQSSYLQPVITQYFASNKSEIWS